MHGHVNCLFRDACNPMAYQIDGARKVFQESLSKRTPTSPEDLDAITTPRDAYLGALDLENSTSALQELDDWAFMEAEKIEGGCEGCPIIALCVQINQENL